MTDSALKTSIIIGMATTLATAAMVTTQMGGMDMWRTECTMETKTLPKSALRITFEIYHYDALLSFIGVAAFSIGASVG
jgi:hypothetical protein